MGWRGILGFEYGIVQGPLGPDISGPDLVAAVANAGGLGFLRAPDWESPDYLRELIQKTRNLTDKPFGVGVVLAFPHEENIKAVLEEKVGSLEEAKKAVNAGVDAIIVQGREAGGHVIGQDGLISLLPRVVDLIGDQDIPVIASGGIVDARGYVAALALGAQGICLGTRFVATVESYAHPTYKRKLIQLDKTGYTDIFGRARWPGAPQRVLQTPFFSDHKSLPFNMNELDKPVIGRSTIHGMEKEIRQFAGTVPNATTTGDIESMAMYAGQGVGLIKEILPAGEVVERLVEGAQHLIRQKFGGI
ncbi:nitronate monooxygenase isoform X2 [Juglans microcarpa x Juglans regia]|uniref:nitronate monooxygenase isoform X2 n=1 Tax=Juglans microcarpa x Juglans regia TaxID=2249226 RepID=UPI001B7E86B4|nr:nitronate monooxygenase isoform X2 [Juglans microcarpa x Juglans regia]